MKLSGTLINHRSILTLIYLIHLFVVEIGDNDHYTTAILEPDIDHDC